MKSFTIGLKLAIASIALCIVSACAYLESPAAQPFDAIAVAVAVDSVVGTNTVTQAARASAVKRIAQEVLAADTGVTATLDNLEGIATAKVAALKLPPGDQAAAQLFLAVLDTAINQYASKVTGGSNVASTQAAIATVCNWVIAEATRLGG